LIARPRPKPGRTPSVPRLNRPARSRPANPFIASKTSREGCDGAAHRHRG
jgi:hypothetical protein